MKRIKGKVWLLMAMAVLLCASCRQPARLYDSSPKEDMQESAVSGQENTEEEMKEAQEEEIPQVICVYVCGEVQNPGIYELPEEARIADALKAAGGMTEQAASTWLNLAEHMTDGQKILVPSTEEAEVLVETQTAQESGLVNLNTATMEQLMTLTGIGESKAKDILSYREAHGSFSKTEELMEIPGIKEGVFQKIKDQITV
ncbi:MAG: competence protein ComEA [Lachnospiraceae bacterium]|jgi:competence protein ComEA|nr:competence protein ComEA [Lachnospiraceae bacterium]